MVTIKTEAEIEILKEAGRRQALYFTKLKEHIVPGVSADFLDKLAFKLITEGGDTPAFLNYRPEGAKKPYPSSLCISINDEVVHGLPSSVEKILKEGDIVGIDMGLSHKGMIVDSAITFPVGKIDKEAKNLIKKTKECLDAGIKAAILPNSIGDIGFAIEEKNKDSGFEMADDLVGHGVGYKLHEDPYVPNWGKKREGLKLKPGMVLAIEPILCEGSGKVTFERDGFTVRTKDGKRSAHFEHTIVITEGKPIVVTR